MGQQEGWKDKPIEVAVKEMAGGLKPCPFCGGEAVGRDVLGYRLAGCLSCNEWIDAEIWNRRTSDPARAGDGGQNGLVYCRAAGPVQGGRRRALRKSGYGESSLWEPGREHPETANGLGSSRCPRRARPRRAETADVTARKI